MDEICFRICLVVATTMHKYKCIVPPRPAARLVFFSVAAQCIYVYKKKKCSFRASFHNFCEVHKILNSSNQHGRSSYLH